MRKYVIYIVLLSLIELSLALYLTHWRADFWNYVEAKNFHGFLTQIGVFTVVALLFCLVTSFATYFIALCTVKWREKLNDKAHLLKTWKDSENGNQRLQQDCRDYPELMLSTIFGLGKSIVYIVVFSISLVFGYNWIYLAIIIGYAAFSTFIARLIAKPLISLNYISQVAEATYRSALTRSNFAICIHNMLSLAKKTKHLNYFQTFYGQLAVVLPIMVVAPAYFGGAMTLGALMQATATMGTISENCSYGIYNFNVINKLMSCHKRLREIGVI